MLNRILKSIAFFLAGVLLSLLQFSWVSTWAWPLSSINLPILALILSLLLFKPKRTWLLALAAGLSLDIISFGPFGAHSLSLLVSIWIASLILNDLLTNRSLYSFLLLSLLTLFANAILYQLFLLLFDWGLSQSSFFLFQSSFWQILAWRILFSLLIVLLLFYVLVTLTRRLKPFLLNKN